MRRRAVLGIAGVVAGALLARLLSVVAAQLPAPFDLVLETPNLATIELLRAGVNPYDPAVYAEPPFVLTLYTPLYHALAALLPRDPVNPFFWGRALSTLCMLGAASLVFAAARTRSLAVPLVAFALFFALRPVVLNTAFLRHDPLALLLAAGALVCTARLRGRSRAYVPALLCVLTLCAKQSQIAAPAACGLHLLLADRRAGLRFGVAFAGLAGAAGGLALLVFGRGFWFSTVVAPSNPVDPGAALGLVVFMAREPLAWVVPALGLVLGIDAARRRGLAVLRESPYPLYVLASVAVVAVTLGKRGASTNYFFETWLALLLWLVYALRERPLASFARGRAAIATAALVAAVALELGLARERDYCFVPGEVRLELEALDARLERQLALLGLRDARLLVLPTARHTYAIQSRAQLSDPFLYGLLWESGKLDPERVVDSLRAGHYDAVLLEAGMRPERLRRGPVKRIVRAVFRLYRPAGSAEHFDVHLRSDGPRGSARADPR